MDVIIASNNSHKIKEIRQILKDKFDHIYSLEESGIICDPEENGNTFYDNALIKANAVGQLTDKAVLADDTGLCVNALNGMPGVHSARYAGNHDNAANRAKLLKKLEDKQDRTAYFSTVVVLRYPDGKTVVGEGRVNGKILKKEEGTNGFGYDTLFFCDDLNKSFGTCSDEEKNSVSHRARALNDLLKKL